MAQANAGNASGQTQAAGASSKAVSEVVVTGTRIQRTGMQTPTPVTVMPSDELQKMAPTNLIDALDQVPQFLNNDRPDTAASKADSAGASNVNLRGLGAKRTLVLLDGRRVVPSNRLGNVDINLFPQELVKRVDVVTGGASAAYGTDAVAGVVNFVLDRNFTGVKGSVQGGLTSRGDHKNYQISLSAGTPIGDRMHLIASGQFAQANRIDNLIGRNWFKSWGLVTNPAWQSAVTAGNCQIDVKCAAGPEYLIRKNVVASNFTDGGLISAPGASFNRYYFLSDGTAVPFQNGNPAAVGFGTNSQVGGSGFNPTTPNPNVHTPAYPHGTRSGSFVPDSLRDNGFLHLDYDASDNIKLFAEGLIGHSKTNSVGTLPLNIGSRALTIYQGNAYLPQWINNAMANEGISSFNLERYNTAADIAQDRFIMSNKTYSFTVGFNADLHGGFFDGWTVNGYYEGGWNHNHVDYDNFVRRDRLPLAVDAVRDPATGQIVCNVTLVDPNGPYKDCVPINLFGTGRASKEAINWINGSMWVQDNTKQQSAELSASGDVYDGWGAGAVSLAVGASYRKQSISQRIGPSDIVNQPGLANDPANGIRGIPPAWSGVDDYLQFVSLNDFQGSFNVKELFAETLVPLIANKPFAQQLNLDLAARWADYSGSGGIWAWKAGLNWQTTSELRFRGTISRDIRAASLEERFDSQGQGASVSDPFLGDMNYTTFQIRGGNPNVNPEKADTFTVGAVYQPSFASGLSVSLDWYSIKVKGAISLLSVQTIVDTCYKTQDPEYCGRITRDSGSGLITNVQNTYINVNHQKVSGFDLEADYNRDVKIFGGGAESINARFLGSDMTKYAIGSTNYVGQVGTAFPGDGYPKFRGT
ncbi:MAG TPA: TonB-dependent receptor, partial [Alphaproteobacteria bacterium]|nr:TonB-dependent receptor [Alphaproteobacteria bacterium]